MRVSELITLNDIQQWKKGDIITITAGTGAGKSHFIKNDLYDYAKENHQKILFLIHRTNCVNQFKMELKNDDKTDVIDIKTYQSIEAKERDSTLTFNFKKYDYIVCDEFHYFMSDATFNVMTDLSLNSILKKSAVKIFMSATGDAVKEYINEYKKLKTIDYSIPIKFDFIESLAFFEKYETIEDLISLEMNNDSKIIVFAPAQQAYELHKKYEKYSLFNCSKSNKGYYKYVDEKKINQMLLDEKFNEKILFTTTVMDAGINIIDKDLKHIVCDVEDTGVLIQSIGRKRITNENDKIRVFIKSRNNKQLNGKRTFNNKVIEKAEYLIKNGDKNFTDENMKKQYGNIIYAVTDENNEIRKVVNEMLYFKLKTYEVETTNMILKGSDGYKEYIGHLFGIEDYYVIEKEYEKENLEGYLDSIVGRVMLQVKDRKELIEMLNVRDGNNNRLLKGIKTLNGMLKENNYNYIIDEFRTSKQIKGKRKYYKSAWRIRRLIDK